MAISHSLLKRIVSALVLGPLVVAAVWVGGVPFYIMMIAVFAVSVREWTGLSRRDGHMQPLLLVSGIVYIAASCVAALWLRGHEISGFYLLLYVFFAIWACDMGAYGAGKTIGGPKMAPSISPNKTWAGLIGGCVATIMAVTTFDLVMEGRTGEGFIDHMPVYLHVAIGAFLAVVGQLGDLLVSVLKRRCGLKDTGNIIPGHGGLLDRIDALLLALPVFAALIHVLEVRG